MGASETLRGRNYRRSSKGVSRRYQWEEGRAWGRSISCNHSSQKRGSPQNWEVINFQRPENKGLLWEIRGFSPNSNFPPFQFWVRVHKYAHRQLEFTRGFVRVSLEVADPYDCLLTRPPTTALCHTWSNQTCHFYLEACWDVKLNACKHFHFEPASI